VVILGWNGKGVPIERMMGHGGDDTDEMRAPRAVKNDELWREMTHPLPTHSSLEGRFCFIAFASSQTKFIDRIEDNVDRASGTVFNGLPHSFLFLFITHSFFREIFSSR
jgi:hypothetical protein